ncbi:vWA domain-containing protein [Jiella pelagia]|uniref:VWA domain-containing protein n=1 Tax=Jiella pelagia TaxID=2986949 RepID=A0ABY7C2R0_9HYPH|nr:vWA domain-containing protein [Jiella pelagia]WAP70366.1 VWA domain-containing protein [Jiella pelagia]
MTSRALISASLAILIFCSTSRYAHSCQTDELARTDAGFILKIVAGSNKVKTYSDSAAASERYTLGLLQPYFVICEDGDYYHITDIQANTVEEALSGQTAYVRRDQVFIWPTREALNFNALIFEANRPGVRAWEDEENLKGFMDSGDLTRFPPAYEEDLESTLKRPRETRPYPVLGSEERKLRGTVDKRVFRSLIPAALPPKTAVTLKDKSGQAADMEVVERALTSATFLVVFDATASMGNFALESAKAVETAFNGLAPQVREKSSVGFIFFRDKDDDEKLVMTKLMPINDGSRLLREASSKMTGGGDDPEPILDATYVGLNFFFKDQQSIGRPVIIGVLNDDAHPTTTGGIDDRVPTGIDALNLAGQLREDGVTVVTAQAGPNSGENLVSVLQTLAETTGGQFIAWNNDGGAAISAAVAELMKGTAVAEVEAGMAIVETVFDYEDYPAIPLKVLDGERLERLRRAGIDYNIEPGSDGVLVREAYIIENNDLLEPRVQIDKETLSNLVTLFNILGTVGVDAESATRSIGEAIAAIAGENFKDDEPINEILTKNAGIQFRTKLLSFDVRYLAGLTPDERLALSARIQEAGNTLGNYMSAHLSELDSEPSIWMPMSVLP